MQPDLPRPAGTFAGPIVSTPSATTRFSRLNHKQWENSVRDALQLANRPGYSSEFVAEPLRSTFDTNGALLSVSSDTFQDYQRAAEKLADFVLKDASFKTRFGADATTFIKSLGKRAFRRPLTGAEVTTIGALFDKGKALIGSGDDFADGAQLVAEYLFQSPHFIYREELSNSVVNGKVPLGAYEVASKLSYAVLGSMPDDLLLAAADGNALSTPEQVGAQAKRLLATAAASESLWDFHDQLLVMRDFDNISKRDTFPGFGTGVADDLKQEARHFIQDVVFGQQRGFTTLFSAPYTFANQRVRGLYGLDNQAAGGSATDFMRLDLDPSQRAGLLTQIGFLAANGEQDTPNIIIRGVHIARKILCSPLPPPPKNVPPLPAIQPNSTNRQRVELATKDAPCNGCHSNIINPLGVALEHLDGVGKFRTQDNGQPVDSSTSYAIDGKTVAIGGAVDLAKAIANSEQGHACYAQHMAEYLYGRVVTRDTDNQLVQQGGWLSHDQESLQNLVVNLLSTDAFLTRLP